MTREFVGLLLLFVCFAHAQLRPPTIPRTYYAEFTVEDTFETGSFPGAVGYDEPNERQYIRSSPTSSKQEVQLWFPDSVFEITYTGSHVSCSIGCCNGRLRDVASNSNDVWPRGWISPSPVSWSASPVSWSASPVSWSASTITISGPPVSWYSDSFWTTIRSSWYSSASWSGWTFSGSPISFTDSPSSWSSNTCSGHEIFDLFSDLSRSRYQGFCNHGSAQGNLFFYTDGWISNYYCMKTNGDPVYIELGDDFGTVYYYFSSFSRTIPAGLFTPPSSCNCRA